MLLHAGACRGQCVFFFFFYQRLPLGDYLGISGLCALRLRHLEPLFRGSGARTYKHTVSHSAKAFAFNINLSHVEKTHATSRLCAAHMQHPCYMQFSSSRCCCSLPLILRPLSVMVATQRGEGRERKEFLVFYHDKWQLALNPCQCAREQFIIVKQTYYCVSHWELFE